MNIRGLEKGRPKSRAFEMEITVMYLHPTPAHLCAMHDPASCLAACSPQTLQLASCVHQICPEFGLEHSCYHLKQDQQWEGCLLA